MRKLLTLAAVAALTAACASRTEEEVGAAPDEGRADTTAVTHAIDSTRTGPPGVGGRPGDATVTPDSVGVDSAVTEGAADTVSTGFDTTMTSTPQDTLGPGETGTGMGDTTLQGDTTGMTTDTTADTSSMNQ